MRNRTKQCRSVWIVVVMGSCLAGTSTIVAGSHEGWNRVSVGPSFLFNVSAEFQHGAASVDPGPGVGIHGADHLYDNGYVRLDDSGNAGNMTWNWGYENPASVTGTTLSLQSVSTPAAGTMQRVSDEPQYGFEIAYDRAFKQLDVGSTACLLGLHFAFGTTFLSIQNRSTVSAASGSVTDTYDLSALPLIPGAPYYGGTPVAGGPIPLLIPDSPATRTSLNAPATALERGKVEGNLYGFRVGPFFETPWSGALRFQISAGLAAVLVDGEFSYREAIGGTAVSGKTSHGEWLFGPYAEGRITAAFTERFSLFAAGGYQNVGDFSLNAGAKSVKVQLDSGFFATLGAGFSF